MAAGIIFSLLAALVINAGNVVEKHALTKLPDIAARRGGHFVRTLVTSKLWMTGFIMCLVGLGLQVMAFALAPIPVVQSIFNAAIVLLLILGRIRLGERLGQLEWAGLGVVVVSVVLMSTSLSNSPDAVGLGGTGTRVLLAGIPTLAVVVAVVAGIRAGRRAVGFLYGVAAGLLYGIAALGTKGASTLLVRHGVVASIPDILTSVYPYVFVVTSVLGMVAYQIGLQRFRISVVGAMSDVVCSTYIVVVGSLVFDEKLPTNTTTLTLRVVGFVGVLAGSVLVALGERSGSEVEMPPIESDMGLGPVLLTEISILTGRPSATLLEGNEETTHHA